MCRDCGGDRRGRLGGSDIKRFAEPTIVQNERLFPLIDHFGEAACGGEEEAEDSEQGSRHLGHTRRLTRLASEVVYEFASRSPPGGG